MTRSMFSIGWKWTMAVALSAGLCGAKSADAGQCQAGGGGAGGGGQIGTSQCNLPGGSRTPQVPRIPGLPQLGQGSNFPIVVPSAVAKQTEPVKILGNAPLVQTPIVTTPPVGTVAALPTVADALARR